MPQTIPGIETLHILEDWRQCYDSLSKNFQRNIPIRDIQENNEVDDLASVETRNLLKKSMFSK